jgi:hypothetical protein
MQITARLTDRKEKALRSAISTKRYPIFGLVAKASTQFPGLSIHPESFLTWRSRSIEFFGLPPTEGVILIALLEIKKINGERRRRSFGKTGTILPGRK